MCVMTVVLNSHLRHFYDGELREDVARLFGVENTPGTCEKNKFYVHNAYKTNIKYIH